MMQLGWLWVWRAFVRCPLAQLSNFLGAGCCAVMVAQSISISSTALPLKIPWLHTATHLPIRP